MSHPPVANPFNNGIVPDAWVDPIVDVQSIHADVSDQCLQLLEQVAQNRTRRSVLIHGAAGSGKTHTLARLRGAAVEPRPFFSYVRLATSPGMIRRHLRHCLVRDLVRKDERGACQLASCLLASLAKDAGTALDPGEFDRLDDGFSVSGGPGGALAETCGRLGLDFHMTCACRLFLQRRHRQAAVHWLESGELPDDARSRLACDIGGAEDESVDAEHMAFQAVLQLIALVTDTRPMLLCFDQIESMQVAADDRGGYFAFGKLAADLFDHCAGLLLVTCMQSTAVESLREVVPAADLHRIAQHELLLGPLTERQARELIRARLDSSPTLRADTRRRNGLWPLDEEQLHRFLASAEPTPRRLLAISRDAYVTAQRMPAGIDDWLSASFEQRRAVPAEATAIGGDVVHGLAVLLAARGFSVAFPDDRQDVDLMVRHADRRLLVTVVNDEGAVLAQRLKRVVDRPPSGPEERILVRSAGLPIPRTARKSWALWSRLAASHDVTPAGLPRIRVLSPTLAALASLEAVRSLMSESRAGDLESHGETVVPEVVTAWIRGHLHEEELDRLVAEIVAGSPAATGPMHRRLRDTMLEVLQRRHVMTIEDLTAVAGCGRSEAEAILAGDAATFGTIGSPPALAFERTTPSP
jgi:hypothetical protein